ncbi:MAG: alpha/beta fold hydrolase [Cyanobacteriota bacterium]|nr:alpha/beta fold hydrolase [Cyanobacteriota bacterium]
MPLETTAMPPGLQTLMVPVRGGACRLWAGRHLPAVATEALPLLVCHGGPGVPSDYLFPLAEILQRPVIFFDQLGCGRSDRPEPTDQEYSLAASVRDLVALIESLVAQGWIPSRAGRPAYHLYGQSFGGILAFETLIASSGPPPPRSLSLSNVPSSVPVLLEEVAALLADLDGDGARFEATHVCRLASRPAALLAAYAPGQPGSHWRGVDVIADWSASEAGLARCTRPVLVLAAEHDFVTSRSMQGWQPLPDQRRVDLEGVAHHALLENPAAYGAQLEDFLQQQEQ